MPVIELKKSVYIKLNALYWVIAQMICTGIHLKVARSPKLLIIPCEPWSIVGSRGDEAMIMAIIQQFRLREPTGDIVILSGTPEFEKTEDGQRLGVRFHFAWRGRIQLRNIFKAILVEAPTECYVLGADCMDGKYSVLTSQLLLASADLAARLGIKSCLTGFSFNDHPVPVLRSWFRKVSSKLTLRVRDPLSLERFTTFTGVEAKLVADVAFLLKPEVTERVQRVIDWVDEQKRQTRKVLGFNLHGMLITTAALKKSSGTTLNEEIQIFQNQVLEQLKNFLCQNPSVAVLLIPHDFRGGGDHVLLKPIGDCLTKTYADRVAGIEESFTATELKALCGRLDSVFTSRMHLGIAALGMGVPIACFAYQGKFAGLFDHFSYPERYVLAPSEVSHLSATLDDFLKNLDSVKKTIQEALPSVIQLAETGIS